MRALFKLTFLFIIPVLLQAAAANDQVTFYHHDALGSPVFATNMAGDVLWHAVYAPYGAVTVQGDNPVDVDDSKSQFAGHRFDKETGLVYMQGRHYSPLLARFMSMDPKPVEAANPYSFNRYAYANNNPYVFIDPNGEDSFLVSRPVAGIIGMLSGKRHNFIVTHANYVGDPKADIWSYGKNNFGNTGRVDGATFGSSDGTHAEDLTFWKELNGLVVDDPNRFTQIAASDDEVAQSARLLLENTDYMAVPFGDSTNSNSAASAVADRAQGSPVLVPDGKNGGNSPGFDKADKMEFMEAQAYGIFQ